MNIGMLWFDNDPKAELTTKVERAATYYRNKYGRNPTLCFVHPSMIANYGGANHGDGNNGGTNGEPANIKTSGIEIRSARTVLPNHIWIGVNGINVT